MTDADAIARALSGPAQVFIEAGCKPITKVLGLAIAVRTDTAFRLPLAAIFAAALRTRLDLEQATAASIELAVHEVLANAIIHGNLGLSSEGRSNTATYAHFCDMLNERLQDPIAAARTIQVAAFWTKSRLSVAVTDEGSGFAGSTLAQSDNAAHGRGLSLVRALALRAGWHQRRRRLTLVFDITRETAVCDITRDRTIVCDITRDRTMSASKALPPIQLAALDCAILLVAESGSQAALAAKLRRNGFHRLLFAADADTALRFTVTEKPDLVLLDLSGNETDFLRLCKTLQQESGRSAIPVLAIIEPGDADDQPRILAAGAADVLIKPPPEMQLIARILVQLERRLLIRDLQDFQQRTAAELATARDMQNALLPDEATIRQIKERYDIGIAAAFKPSAELGGDLWGAWSIDATRMGVYACDVSGHGTIAAINTFRLHTIMARNDFDRSDAGRFLSSLNDQLTGLLGGGQFITMFYAVIDTRRDRMTYAAAGSPEPLLALPGSPLEGLDGSGVPLGIVAGIAYPTQQVPFGPGARLVLQSDALAEARLADDALLGNPAATAMVTAALAHPTPEAVIAHLTQDIAERVGDSLDDDLTLVCIERPGQIDDHHRSVSAAPQRPVAGRLLSAGRPTAHRLLVQQTAAELALAVDVAPDLTCASRFLAEYGYDIVVVDVSPVPEEWLELFRTIATANRRSRIVSIGMPARMAKLLATSLGLALVANLEMPVDAASLRIALAAALASDSMPSGKGARGSLTEADLRHSLETGEITCSFQPQVSLTTGRLVGAETLARWTTEEYGAISSAAFMSLVANGGAAVLLADVTLRAALAACASWRTSVSGIGVAVNFSAASLAEPDLASLVLARLREADVAPDALTVEVAEADAVRSIPTLAALRQIGVNISLDGFGHGETSLLSLGQLPIGTVKIGRSVVQACAADPEAMRLLHAIVGASHAFNLKVAAVGVEIHAEEQMLREAGCEIAQGWLYGPAMPADAILRLLALP